jgi:hypothetical protein
LLIREHDFEDLPFGLGRRGSHTLDVSIQEAQQRSLVRVFIQGKHEVVHLRPEGHHVDHRVVDEALSQEIQYAIRHEFVLP